MINEVAKEAQNVLFHTSLIFLTSNEWSQLLIIKIFAQILPESLISIKSRYFPRLGPFSPSDDFICTQFFFSYLYLAWQLNQAVNQDVNI